MYPARSFGSISQNGNYIADNDAYDKVYTHPRGEQALHYRVIDRINETYSDNTVIPGLGEYQTSEGLRLDAYNKGYKGGQCDIMILNLHKNY